jgi:ketosteroid isomerase-like protein
MRGCRIVLAAGWLAMAPPALAMPERCPAVPTRPVSAAAQRDIAGRSAQMAAARERGDVPARLAHYAADSLTMVDYQRPLYGPSQAKLYYAMLGEREKLTGFTQTPAEYLALEGDVLERGTFRAGFAGGAPAREGRYMHLWRRQADGSWRLKVELWGYASRTEDPAPYRLGRPLPTGIAAQPGDPGLGAELERIHAAEARAVQTHDISRIDSFAPDAVFVPYADSAKVGIAVIRPYMTDYIVQGRGATFDSVRTWNLGFEQRGAYVIEYPKFEVVWRSGANSGTVSGGGLRIWRREPDCSLKTIRQMGTHD